MTYLTCFLECKIFVLIWLILNICLRIYYAKFYSGVVGRGGGLVGMAAGGKKIKNGQWKRWKLHQKRGKLEKLEEYSKCTIYTPD